jgi:hypothetical protein
MADSDFKPHTYDLLYRLNAAFARVNKNVALLGQLGIFDAETVARIQKRSEELRADTNFHLLETLQGIEQQDRTRFKTD